MNIDATLVRNWGLAIGAAALAGALGVATMSGDPQAPAPPAPAPQVAGPLPSAPPAAAPIGEPAPVFDPASAEGPPAQSDAPLSFLVRFEGSGPMGRAQAIAGEGRDSEARRAAETALRRQGSLRGLCFDRFTIGGAEMVLYVCASVPAASRAQASALWLARLRDIGAVAYAEPNAVAEPGAQ